MRITVWNPSKKGNHLGKVIGDRKIITEFTRSISSTRIGRPVLMMDVNPLSANPTKWSNTLKYFVTNLPMNCLSMFDHFVKLVLKGLKSPKIKH